MTGTKTHRAWVNMRQRCLNPRNPDYRYYGGIGVTVDERWVNSFEAFLQDMGLAPGDLTLDRIDPFGNYDPDNCRWVDRGEQSRNQRRFKPRNPRAAR